MNLTTPRLVASRLRHPPGGLRPLGSGPALAAFLEGASR
jgi:hypothetical protein